MIKKILITSLIVTGLAFARGEEAGVFDPGRIEVFKGCGESEPPSIEPMWWSPVGPAAGDYWGFSRAQGSHPHAPDPAGMAIPLPAVPRSMVVPGTTVPGEHYVVLPRMTSVDAPEKIPLPDSFWYYGKWYVKVPLWISANGWAAFENDGKAHPTPANPADPFDASYPNAVFAPYWTALNADGPDVAPPATPPHRVLVGYDKMAKILNIEWYRVKDAVAPGREFTFNLLLWLGGKGKLREACGTTIYSTHFIDFGYIATTPAGAWQPGTVTGIENHGTSPKYHIRVPPPGTPGTPIATEASIRFYHRKIFIKDMALLRPLAPYKVVARYTKYQCIVSVGNMGREIVPSYSVTLRIKDIGTGKEVYNKTVTGPALDYVGSGRQYIDTIYFMPVWDRPEELGTKYELRYEITGYAGDECLGNNVLYDTCEVACELHLGYDWKDENLITAWAYGRGGLDACFGTTYGSVDKWLHGTYPHQFISYTFGGGMLLLGGFVWLHPASRAFDGWHVEVWEPGAVRSPTAVGRPARRLLNPLLTDGEPKAPGAGWSEARFRLGPYAGGWFGMGQNVWVGYMQDKNFPEAPYVGMEYVPPALWRPLLPLPVASPSWSGNPIAPGDRWGGLAPPWGAWRDVNYVYRITAISHLGWRTPPRPPAYHEELHDIAVSRIEQPAERYVIAGKEITPQCWVANLGRQEEVSTTEHPIEVFFNAVSEIDKFDGEAIISRIGWPGSLADDPDSILVSVANWKPSNVCKPCAEESLVYKIKFWVELNKVGPKNEADHCPYNDTLETEVVSLWEIDAACREITSPKQPNPDRCVDTIRLDVGTKFKPKVKVANTGYIAIPPVGKRFVVKCEIVNLKTGDAEYTASVTPATIPSRVTDPKAWIREIEFPDEWTVGPDEYKMTVTVELDGDLCPHNNKRVLGINYVGIAEAPKVPTVFELSNITPNPFLNRTTIEYAIPVRTFVSINIYDLTGKLIRTLVNGNIEPGFNKVVWDGLDNSGREASSGIYLVKMVTPEFTSTKKIVLAR